MARKVDGVAAQGGDPPGEIGAVPGAPAPATRRQRWLARLAFAAAFAAVAVVLLSGALRSISALLVGFAGLAIACAAAWWFLANRGVVRWLACAVLVAAPVAVIVVYVAAGLLWEIALGVALAAAAVAAGRAALSSGPSAAKPREHAAVAPQRQPFVIMNPRSGGGKVGKFGLKDKAAALGAEVALLEGPGMVDVAALARQAVDAGADLVGVAGGDGTQALVAGIAAERDVPMMVISAGTRNHFALDLGLDREDPASCLSALTDGVELRIDLGLIGDRTFVNNASFGAYAQVVQSPAYRDDKSGTTLQMLPDLLSGHQGAHLVVRVDGQVILDGPQAVLVSNNPYETGDIAGLGRRARLDQGVLGVVGAVAVTAAVEGLTWQIVVYAVLSLTVIRLAPVAAALAGARLGRAAVGLVGWFGPRGLASVVFALLALEEIGQPAASQAVALITVTGLLSVVAHGVTAEPLARQFGPRLAPAADGADHAGLPDVPERRLIRRAPAAASGTGADPARQDR